MYLVTARGQAGITILLQESCSIWWQMIPYRPCNASKICCTNIISQCGLFLLGLRGRNVQFVLQWGQLPGGCKQVPGLPGDFTLNCVVSDFAIIVHCHISALTLTSLYFREKLGVLKILLGLYGLSLPFHVILELAEGYGRSSSDVQ